MHLVCLPRVYKSNLKISQDDNSVNYGSQIVWKLSLVTSVLLRSWAVVVVSDWEIVPLVTLRVA